MNVFWTLYLWNDLTILWDDLTLLWNEMTWNDPTMERSDRKPMGRYPVRSFHGQIVPSQIVPQLSDIVPQKSQIVPQKC